MSSSALFSTLSLLLVQLLFVQAAKHNLPSYVKTCSRNDPKLNECALKHGRELLPRLMKGDPSIRLPVLEPLKLDRVEIVTSGGAKGGGLHLICTKCLVHGLGTATLNDIKLDPKRRHLDLRTLIPMLSVVGDYHVDGKLLLFPVFGKGLANLTLFDLDVTAGLDWKLIKRKGDEYAHMTRHTVDFTASNFKLALSGLFNGDKALNDNMNTILNDSWKEILHDLKPSISDTVGEIIKYTINNIFDMIPYNQYLPDK